MHAIHRHRPAGGVSTLTARGRLVRSAAAVAVVLAMAANASAQSGHGGFIDVAAEAGLTHKQRTTFSPKASDFATGGAAVGDFFGNGYLDIYFTRADNTDILYRNMGDGTFQDVTAQVFGDEMTVAPTSGAMFADLDNDGALDLYVTSNGGTRHYLYMNDGHGKLTEQAEQRGLDQFMGEDVKLIGMSSTAGDYDNDGYLDVYVADWSEPRENGQPINRLYRNRGAEAPGYFEDVTVSAGIEVGTNDVGFTGRFADMDRNGHMDLLTVNDVRRGQYFVNNGDGTFTEVGAEYGTGTSGSEMGSTVADYNNDGYLDWFVTAIDTVGGNRMYRNEMGRGIEGLEFTDQTALANVFADGWGWGTSFLDYNNNGLRDLVMVNGFIGHPNYPAAFWENTGPENNFRFEQIGPEVGVTDGGQGRGLLVADFFNNGQLDLLIINHGDVPVLYKNMGGENSWLRINTVGEVSNSMGIGAFITVQPDLDDDFKLVHDINLGGNYLAHNETTAHFGLGDLEGTIDYIHILWPSGIEQEFYDVEANQLLTIHELGGIEELVATPEPTTAMLLGAAAAMLVRRRGRTRRA